MDREQSLKVRVSTEAPLIVGVARAAPARIARRMTEHARLVFLIRFIAGVLLRGWVRSWRISTHKRLLAPVAALRARSTPAACREEPEEDGPWGDRILRRHVNVYIPMRRLSRDGFRNELRRWSGTGNLAKAAPASGAVTFDVGFP